MTSSKGQSVYKVYDPKVLYFPGDPRLVESNVSPWTSGLLPFTERIPSISFGLRTTFDLIKGRKKEGSVPKTVSLALSLS